MKRYCRHENLKDSCSEPRCEHYRAPTARELAREKVRVGHPHPLPAIAYDIILSTWYESSVAEVVELIRIETGYAATRDEIEDTKGNFHAFALNEASLKDARRERLEWEPWEYPISEDASLTTSQMAKKLERTHHAVQTMRSKRGVAKRTNVEEEKLRPEHFERYWDGYAKMRTEGYR